MEPDYLQFQIKSVILHLYSTLALPSWHGNSGSVSIQLTMFFPEYPDPDFAGSVNSINYFGCDQKELQSRDINFNNIGKSILYVHFVGTGGGPYADTLWSS